MKIVVDTADASSIIDLDQIRPETSSKDELGPVHIGRHDPALVREDRLFNLRLPAVRRFQKAQNINGIIGSPPVIKKLGIITVGKTTYEVNDALDSLGIDDPAKAGIGLFSVVMPWPVDPASLVDFAKYYDEVLVVEEKRSIVEDQVARAVVNLADRAVITGKLAPDGSRLLPETGEITHAILMTAISERASAHGIAMRPIKKSNIITANLPKIAARTPWYCAGCPHNSSTKLPDDEIVGMGIGCHSISGFLTPDSITNFTQMGGEGASWIGRAPFSSHHHSFQNIGDGTYAHSGYLGIRAAVAAGVNITFKILFNGAVAMTGGQAVEGGQPPWVISRQLAAEGVVKIAVVSDDLDALLTGASWAQNCEFYDRQDMLTLQQELKLISGVTAIIYVQGCATELRRKRKRGLIADKPETIIINDAVCEGCGDCAVKSNCVAVKPLMQPEGEKRQIDQSLCNKDMSCLSGFCPSFVTVKKTGKRDQTSPTKTFIKPAFPEDITLPMPPLASGDICNIFVAGIGGTGVSTLAGILIMAARIDGIAGTAVNQTGLSQKNGGVTSQIRLARHKSLNGHMVRLPSHEADLLIGCDAVVAANDMVLSLLNKTQSRAILNDNIDPVGVAGVGIGGTIDMPLVMTRLGAAMNPDYIVKSHISSLANQLLGSTTSSNIIMLGWALQKGFIPLSIDAVEAALRLNGTSLDNNLAALRWGRLLAHAPEKLFAYLDTITAIPQNEAAFTDPDKAITYFTVQLTSYQNATYAARYKAVITQFMARLKNQGIKSNDIGMAAALALYRAMAIKDEYEVARHLTSNDFTTKITAIAGEDAAISYHLAPPILAWLKARDGSPRKIRFGRWLTPYLRGLARLSWLRDSWADPFGYATDRRAERAYREMVIDWLDTLGMVASPDRKDQIKNAIEMMLNIRGYGHVRAANHTRYATQITAIIEQISTLPPPIDIAAE